MIPYSTQNISESDIRAVQKILRSGWITQGPAIESFEKALAKKVGAKYCVAFNSGTAALHGAYAAAGVGNGDEVLVPALTFAATANAALYLGAKPVFVDVDLKTGLIDFADAKKKITRKTKMIVPVDYAGAPADLATARAFAKKHKLAFVEDGAQSLGAIYKRKPVGTQADMTMFSFHPVKSITTGEGGVIVTNDKTAYEFMKMFRTHGIVKGKKGKPAWYQEMQTLGFNYRITDFQAALGESQLTRLGSFIAKRRARAAIYHKLLRSTPGLILPQIDTNASKSAWHLYPVRLTGSLIKRRDEIFNKLREKGIGVQVHYLPVYLHPYYQKMGYKKGLCPNAERYSFSELSIPLYPTLSLKNQRFVATCIRDILGA